MMTGRTGHHDGELHVLTGSYALDAIAGRERIAFERHLRGCPPCTAEVGSFQAVVARLPLTIAVAPPDGLRERVRREAWNVRQPRLAPIARVLRQLRTGVSSGGDGWRGRAARRTGP